MADDKWYTKDITQNWADMLSSDDEGGRPIQPPPVVIQQPPCINVPVERTPQEHVKTYDRRKRNNNTNRPPEHTYEQLINNVNEQMDIRSSRITQKEECIKYNKVNGSLPESAMFYDRETEYNEDRFENVCYQSLVKFNFFV